MGAPPAELKAGLKQRHLTMIAMGGVIGAGLFIGSGVVIGDAGPAAFLSYLITGVVIILVMRMLGEMAVANPSTGSFADYARRALGGWAGFTVAWLYWYFWVIVVGFEAIAGAEILQYWIDAPLWLLSLILMVLMTATNLMSVASFGEFEFWFAGIKVAAIVVFIACAGLYVFGLWPGRSMDFSNLYAHGGFLPNGVGSIFSAIIVVVFAMVGAEVATIAAAESADPAKAINKATRAIVGRITIFFVLSVFLLTVVLPWNDEALGTSPFVAAFERMGIPFAPDIMNAVVLTAVLSVLNSGVYTASRMLFVLAARREAPIGLMEVGKSGVPRKAILTSSVIGFLCVIAAAVDPDHVFYFLINSIGPISLIIYVLIGISQIVLRRRTDTSQLVVKMWLFPYLSIAVILAILAVLIQMALDPELNIQLALALVSTGVIVAAYFIARKVLQRPFSAEAEAAAAVSTEPHRVLVLANETVEGRELIEELHNIDKAGKATYWVCVPANPIDTHQAMWEGALTVWERTAEAAQARLGRTLETLRGNGLTADGALGDYRPLRALDAAVAEFRPDRLVVSTLPEADSAWLRYDVLDRIRETYHSIPVTHIIVQPEAEEATHA